MSKTLMKALVLLAGFVSISLVVGFARKGSSPTEAPGATIWLGRMDGSKSCDPNSGMRSEQVLAQMKEAGIHVQALARGNDGKVRAQMCGLPTGRLVGVLIREEDRVHAEATGWVRWPEGVSRSEEALPGRD